MRADLVQFGLQPLKCSCSGSALFGDHQHDLADAARAKNCKRLPHIFRGEAGALLHVIQTKPSNGACDPFRHPPGNFENVKNICKTRMKRLDSSTCLHAVGDKAVEFFFASDAR